MKAPRPPASCPAGFYGWYVAVACGLMMWVTVGVGYYGLATFLRPLEDEHDWSARVVSGASGLFFVISGVSAFVVGPLIDRRGPKRMMALGAILTGASAAAVGFVETVWQLCLVYTVMALAYGMGAGSPSARSCPSGSSTSAPGDLAVVDRGVTGRRHARAPWARG